MCLHRDFYYRPEEEEEAKSLYRINNILVKIPAGRGAMEKTDPERRDSEHRLSGI